MKKKLLSILMCVALMLSVASAAAIPAAATAEPDVPDDEDIVTVSLTAGKDHAHDNYFTLSGALSKYDVSRPLTVKIASPGTYYISAYSEAALRLRSNTTIDLGGATLMRWDTMGNVFQNCDATGETRTGTGYTMSQNITIKNGTIDGSGGSNSDINVMNLGHATGITIENLTVLNCKGGHLIEFAGCQDCTIRNCTFSGFRANSAGKIDVAEEAVQFDICDNDVSKIQWNGIFYSDSTTCRNITVDNCTFNDYPSGVGNHKGIYGNHNSNITITNCTFNNSLATKQPAIWAYDFDNSTISGNTITGNYSEGIKLSACNNTTVSNNTINLGAVGIYVTLSNSYTRGKVDVTTEEYCSACNVNSNTITATGSGIMGMCIYSSSGVNNVNSNKITAASEAALTVSSKAKVSNIKNNTLTSNTTNGLLIMTNATAGTVSGNTVTGKQEALVVRSEAAVTNVNDNKITSKSNIAMSVSAKAKVSNIKNNTMTASTNTGLLIMTNATAGTVSGNTVSAKSDAILVRSDAVVTNITSNKSITSSAGNGVYVSGATAKNISSNTIKNCKENGISLTSSGKTNKIAFNTVSGCGGYGIRVNNTGITIQYGGNTLTGNTAGKDKISAKTTEVTDLEPPVLKKASVVYGGVSVSWNASRGASKYRVFVKNGSSWSAVGDTTSTSFKHTGVKTDTNYTYTVRCLSKDGKKYLSGFDAAGVSVHYIASPTISKIEGTAKGFKLTIGKTVGSAKYRVFIKSGSSWKKLGDTASTTYTHNSLKSNTKYTYTVRAMNDTGAYIAAYNTTGWTNKFLSAPKISKLANSKKGVVITIGKVTGAEKYRIYIKSGSSWKKLADTTSTSYTHTAAKNGTSYTYTVRCISSNAKQYQSGYNTTGKTIKCKR